MASTAQAMEILYTVTQIYRLIKCVVLQSGILLEKKWRIRYDSELDLNSGVDASDVINKSHKLKVFFKKNTHTYPWFV